MAKSLTAKDLFVIDELATFFTASRENAELLRVVTGLIAVASKPGASEVFSKRVDEMKAARDPAK